MIKFSKKWLRDRIYACWTGKNIGGTLGAPYEMRTEINDISGFATEAGEPLPNDDLDLQLVWLRAVDQLGPNAVNSKVLGEYWTSFITPHWSEYGVSKSNMREGFLPPLSGHMFNEEWRNSNGAWIRTEIWSCLYPGNVEKAIHFAYEDACVDHGLNEGTYAAIFVAAMESSAFVIQDSRKLLEIGLSKIPEDCRVARSVKIVIDAYDNGTNWKETRTMLVEDSADLGWFQAPANIGFVVIGLLYGENDFKKSLILAVNCGDDTDCTAATLGSLMGIMHGMEGIPDDWCAHIGDKIKTICITEMYGRFPRTCTELTDAVMNLLPVTMRTDNDSLLYGDIRYEIGDENDFSGVDDEKFKGRGFTERLDKRSPYSFTVENVYVTALVEFYDRPVIEQNGQLKCKISLIPHTMVEQKHYNFRWFLPEGWTVRGKRHLFTPWPAQSKDTAQTEFVITANENVDGMNKIVAEIVCQGRPTELFVPINIMG